MIALHILQWSDWGGLEGLGRFITFFVELIARRLRAFVVRWVFEGLAEPRCCAFQTRHVLLLDIVVWVTESGTGLLGYLSWKDVDPGVSMVVGARLADVRLALFQTICVKTLAGSAICRRTIRRHRVSVVASVIWFLGESHGRFVHCSGRWSPVSCWLLSDGGNKIGRFELQHHGM